MSESQIVTNDRAEERAAQTGDDLSYWPRVAGRRVFYGDVPSPDEVGD